ncbi:MAG: ATP-dependent zinc metalloprotease FtsH [Oscillospiraceae bacterium]
MAPNKNNKTPDNNNGGKKKYTGFISIIIWALILTILANYFLSGLNSRGTVTVLYSDFRAAVEAGAVELVDMDSSEFTFYLKDGWSMNADGELTYQEPGSAVQDDPSAAVIPEEFRTGEKTTYVTAPWSDDGLIPLMEEMNVKYGPELVPESSYIVNLLLSYVVPMVIMVVLLMLLYRFMFSKMGGGGMGGIGGVGKANAKVYVEKKTGVTFKDVAGQDEAKESLEEIIDFLHNPGKYTEIGAKLPKGALLVGSPGTGKTLLAKAVAGEANVPFFSISGSDFVEMFVGVGASRVRDLFKEAAKMAPCIIFIDEIDTIGKSRDASKFGGNDEREQTLNQLLAELDGFDPTKGVIVLAATNRPEVLDKALLRPGRFDRRITIDRPNLAGRLATLQVHTRNIRLAEDVDLNRIAQATAGCVGADLANLVNEAALRAVRKGRKAVNQEDLLVSFETVIAGTEKKGTVLTELEKKIIAYHEVGHALVAAKQKNAQPVSKITIVPHTQGALGYTMQLPEEEKFLMSKEDILTEIRTLLAGRSAEELVFDTQTSGAANDIERATDMARKLVTMYGMSDKFGMMGLATIQNQYLDGGMGLTCAQDTAAQIDAEILDIIERCHKEARQILEDNREMLDKIAGYLLEKETITGQEMMCILEGKDPALADNYGATGDDKRRSLQGDVEPPARSVHMVSEPIAAPPPAEEPPAEEAPTEEPKSDGEKTEE